MNPIIIIILFLSIPILVVGYLAIMEELRKRRVRKSLSSTIYKVAIENGAVILEIDYFLNRAISVDKEKKKVLFAIHHGGSVKGFCVDIDSLAYCRVGKTFDESSQQVKELFLEMKGKGKKEIARLPFFDRSNDNFLAMPLLIGKAKYWKTKIDQNRIAMTFNHPLEFVL